MEPSKCSILAFEQDPVQLARQEHNAVLAVRKAIQKACQPVLSRLAGMMQCWNACRCQVRTAVPAACPEYFRRLGKKTGWYSGKPVTEPNQTLQGFASLGSS